MLNSFYHTVRSKNLKTLLLIQHGGQTKCHFHLLPAINAKSCLCGQYNPQNNSRNNFITELNQPFRIHSSLSGSKRQKVVLETSTPKIVLEKLPGLREKVLRDEKNNVGGKVVLWRDLMDPYIKLMRIDKPIVMALETLTRGIKYPGFVYEWQYLGTWLLYWPCTWSIALATIVGHVPVSVAVYNLGLFLAGAVVMRGAGCTINDLWDRDIDGRVERTRDRPLVSGAISEKHAVAFLAAQLSVGLAILLQLNWYSVALGASSMLLVVTYPLAKRFTNYPQLFLGATFNWGALLGWAAIQGSVEPAICLPLYVGSLCWTIVYDTIYAHQDKLDDARIGIKSTALTFGSHTKPLLTAAGAGALVGVGVAGAAAGLHWPYYLALSAAGAHVGRQIYTLDTENPNDCACKFKSNSLVGLIIFLGIMGGGWNHYFKSRPKKDEDSIA